MTKPPKNLPDWVPKKLSEMVTKMLDKNPITRLTCEQAIDMLASVEESKFEEKKMPPKTSAASASTSKRPSYK